MSEIPAEVPAEPEAPAAEPEVEYAQITAEEWQQNQELLAQAQEQLTQLAPLAQWGQQSQAEAQPGQVQVDPFAENFSEQLGQMIDERMTPYSSYQEEQMLSEAEERAKDIITDLQAQGGEFIYPQSVELARSLANDYIGEAQQKHGFGPQAAEAALAQAVDRVREIEQEVGKAYSERQQNQLSTLAGAPREPGAAGAPAAQTLTTPPGDEMAVWAKHFGG